MHKAITLVNILSISIILILVLVVLVLKKDSAFGRAQIQDVIAGFRRSHTQNG